MARKKKPPTFGQKDLAPSVPMSQWRPIQDLTNLVEYDGTIYAGQTARQAVQAHARFMFPDQVQQYQDWATAHPNVDPRTWEPLATSYISPFSDAGQAVAVADVKGQIQEGVYGSAPGQPQNPLGVGGPSGPTGLPATPAQDNADNNPIMSLLNGAGAFISDNWNSGMEGIQVGARALQYGLMSGYDAWQASQRDVLGVQQKQEALIAKYGLDKNMAATAFPEQDVPMTQSRFGSLDKQDAGVSKPMGSFTPEQQDAIRKAQEEWSKEQLSSVPGMVASVAGQTPAGAIAKNPSLLTQDKGWTAANPKVAEETLKKSIEAYDMRTTDEIARGVAPVGWTPGRGMAHLYWSPDTTAFNALSGAIDFTTNLTVDPANIIPMNAIGKAPKAIGKVGERLPGALGERAGRIGQMARAMEAGQEKIIVQTTGPRFGSTSSGMVAARPAARGTAARAGLDLSGTVIDPDLLASGPRLSNSTGLVTSPHGSFVMGDTAWQFLNSARGTEIVDSLVGNTSASDIWLRSNRKIDPSLARDLASAETGAQVRALLGTRMGMDLTDPRAIRNFGAPALWKNMAARDSRFMQFFRKAPQTVAFDLEDDAHTLSQLERFARGAGMRWEDITPHLDNVLNSSNGAERYQHIYGDESGAGGLLRAVADHLTASSGGAITEGDAGRLTRAFQGGVDAAQRDYINTLLGEGAFGAATADGSIGKSLLMNELLTRMAILPDYRRMRLAVSGIGNIRRAVGIKDVDSKIQDYLTSITSTWKSSVLVRPAYMLREVGEMSVSAGLAGYDSLFTHPANFIGLALSTAMAKEASTSMGKVLKATAGGVSAVAGPLGEHLHLTEGLGTIWPLYSQSSARVTGEPMFEALNKMMRGEADADAALTSMYGGMSAVHGNFNVDERLGRMASRFVTNAMRDTAAHQDDYVTGYIGKLERLHGDPDMRRIADPAMPVADVLQAFRDHTKDIKATQRPDLLGTDPMQDVAYLDGYRDIYSRLTVSDPLLQEAVLTGKFDGKPLNARNKALRDHLSTLMASPVRDTMPETMPVWRPEDGNALNRLATEFFDMTGELSDVFARGPLFRQAYTRGVLELGEEMAPATKAQIVANLRNAGDHEQARLVQAIPANGTLTVSEVDHMAGQFARNESRRIFYDAHERQNWALAMRVIAPFAQATANTFRRWGQMSLQNPQLMYRTMKPLNYGQQEGSSVIYGAMGAALVGGPGPIGKVGRSLSDLYAPGTYGWTTPDTRHIVDEQGNDITLDRKRLGGANGFFFTDQYGDRKFAYPGMGLLGALVGTPAGALSTSSLSGLNVAGTSLSPGVGPLITFPASLFAQEVISRDDAIGQAMRFIFPYGLPDGSLADKALGSFGASWLNKMNKATDDENGSPSQAVKIMPVLLSEGDYMDPDGTISPANQARLISDANAISTRMTLLNAIMGAFTPATLNTMTQVAVKNGDQKSASMMVLQSHLKQEFDKYTHGPEGYSKGFATFVHDYGSTALLSVLPPTASDGPQATNDVWRFRTQEPDAYDQHKAVIGYFFAAGGPIVPGDTSPSAYAPELGRAQRVAGERYTKKPQDYLSDGLNQLGWMLWNPKSKEIEQNQMLTDDQKATARANLRDDIIHRTGGAWTGKPKDASTVAREMEQVHSALTDESVMTLSSAPYIKAYMQARDDTIKAIRAKGGTGNLSAKENADEANALIERAKALNAADRTGGFNNIWNRLFVDEFGGSNG